MTNRHENEFHRRMSGREIAASLAFAVGVLAVIGYVQLGGGSRWPSFHSQQTEINLAKFSQLQPGMSYAAVQAITGTPGAVMSQSVAGAATVTSYQWKNADGSNAIVMFQDDRLTTKVQAGLK